MVKITLLRLKKNFIFTLLMIVSTFMYCFPLIAEENVRVYDQCGLFSSQQITELEEAITHVKSLYPLDVVIVTTDDDTGKSSQTYADDFYDEGGFGYAGTYDGILLLINMDAREVYISTDGETKRYFTDARISSMLDEIYPYLGAGDYAKGADCFLNLVAHYMAEGIPADQYTVEGDFVYSPTSHEPFKDENGNSLSITNIALSLLAAAMAALVLSFSTRGNISYRYKHPRFTVPETVPNDLSIHYTEKEDHFVTSHTTRTRIEDNDNNHSRGSRSSSHTSSGGHSHGGGGRGF